MQDVSVPNLLSWSGSAMLSGAEPAGHVDPAFSQIQQCHLIVRGPLGC
jgi:hypothetical protein